MINFNQAEISFWKKFSRLLLIGSSVLILLFVSQSISFQNIKNVQAEDSSPIPTTEASPIATPVPPPVPSPISSPEASPVATPTSTPIPSPVSSPVPSPVASPVATPVPPPIASPVATTTPTPAPDPTTTPTPTPTSSTTTSAPAPVFAGGNIVTAVNNTQRTSDWADPVPANPGEIIEYRIVAQNVQEGSVAHDVTFHVNFPTSPSNSPQVQGVISADGVSISDTATVNVNGTAGYLIIYESGHTRVFSPGCPDGCNADDSFRDGGNINVGDLAFGESAQVLFKAGITNPVPTSTPTPTIVPTPVPTSPPAGGTTNNNCTGDNSCSGTATANATATVNTPPATQVLGVTTLPKTGLPALAWSALAFIPAGLKMRRFSRVKKDLENHPSYIAEERKFKL